MKSGLALLVATCATVVHSGSDDSLKLLQVNAAVKQHGVSKCWVKMCNGCTPPEGRILDEVGAWQDEDGQLTKGNEWFEATMRQVGNDETACMQDAVTFNDYCNRGTSNAKMLFQVDKPAASLGCEAQAIDAMDTGDDRKCWVRLCNSCSQRLDEEGAWEGHKGNDWFEDSLFGKNADGTYSLSTCMSRRDQYVRHCHRGQGGVASILTQEKPGNNVGCKPTRNGLAVGGRPEAQPAIECLPVSATESVAACASWQGYNCRSARNKKAMGYTCCDSRGRGSRPDCREGQRGVTWTQANNICTSKGLRLCTKEELQAGSGSGKGCRFDHFLNWVSDDCGTQSAVGGRLEAQPASWFCVARGLQTHKDSDPSASNKVDGPYSSLEQAKEVLNQRESKFGHRQMICEMSADGAKVDPHTVGGANQGGGVAAGFNKWWADTGDIHKMTKLCNDDTSCSNGK